MNPRRDHRVTSRGGGGNLSDDASAAARIVAEIFELRDRGQVIAEAQVVGAHPKLAQQIEREFRRAEQIRQAMLAAERVEELPPPSPDSSFELNSSSASSDNVGESSSACLSLPRINGYLLQRQIDRGGQAAVYEAIQEVTKRRVAIKVMAGGPFASSRHRARFEREASILAGFEHPNIVGILDKGRTSDGSFYVALQFIDGCHLDDCWKRIQRDAQGLRTLATLFAIIAEAAEEAHAHGIVHRDLKPSNIIVDARMEPHLLDFGLARPVDDLADLSDGLMTATGQILGSLPWASPEHAAGDSNSLQAVSDVYSIGVMLYQAITGDFPYSVRGSIQQILERIRFDTPQAASMSKAAWPGIDPGLDAIVAKSLSKDPVVRYRSGGALGSDLRAWLAGSSTTAIQRPISRPKRFWRLGAIVGVTLLATGGIFYHSRKTFSSFELPHVQNVIGMNLVRIPTGTFMMGSPDSELNRSRDEMRHVVHLDKPFYISVTDVTEDEYSKVMPVGQTDSRWHGSNLPICNITWIEANDFCYKLSELDHAHYRLPTEEEWEYACRAGSDLPYPEQASHYIWSRENSNGKVHPVAQKQPNIWGLFDVQGNVSQWCSDEYMLGVGQISIAPATQRSMAIRGGSVLRSILECRAAERQHAGERFARPDLGFRVVRDP